MTTLLQIRTDVRSKLREATADFYSDAEITTWVNYAYKRFIQKTEWLEKMRGIVLVANQFEYTLPSDIIKIIAVRYRDQWTIDPKDLEAWFRYVGTFQRSEAKPEIYRQFPWDGKLRLYPIPNTAGEATTITGSHNTSVTTITVGDTTDFPYRGIVILNDSEQVRYYAKTATTLLQCVRGDGGTTAASYTGTESVKWAEIELYYTYLPTALSADGDILATPSIYDECIVDYAFGVALTKNDKENIGKAHISMAESVMNEAREERAKMARDKYTYIKDATSEVEEVN